MGHHRMLREPTFIITGVIDGVGRGREREAAGQAGAELANRGLS